MGTIALTEFAAIPYNMNMKNTKAIFLIVLGSFIIATGFAFAEKAENVSLGQLENLVKSSSLAVEQLPGSENISATPTANVTTVTPDRAAAAVPAVGAAAPAPAPTTGEKAKKFIKKNMGTMVLVGAGAYLGMALFGPVGIVIGGLFMFALMFMGNL